MILYIVKSFGNKANENMYEKKPLNSLHTVNDDFYKKRDPGYYPESLFYAVNCRFLFLYEVFSENDKIYRCFNSL